MEFKKKKGRPFGTGTERYNIKTMVKKIHKYTEEHEFPILKECVFLNNWNYDYFMELQRNNEVLRKEASRLLCKKEIAAEKYLVTGQNNTGMVFILKQLGWKDNPDPLVVNLQKNSSGNRSEKLSKCSTETLEELDRIYAEMDAETKQNGQVAEESNAT